MMKLWIYEDHIWLDINVPTRSALVLETEGSFVSLVTNLNTKNNVCKQWRHLYYAAEGFIYFAKCSASGIKKGKVFILPCAEFNLIFSWKTSVKVTMTKVISNLEAHRQEKNEEIELLKTQVDELDELRRNNDLLETHCKSLNSQLEAERNEAKTK